MNIIWNSKHYTLMQKKPTKQENWNKEHETNNENQDD